MSISEKANDLLNKFGGAQYDFMVWNTPDNAVARDKARQEISDHIAELEEIDKLRSESISTLNQANANNEDEIELLEKRIAELEEDNRSLGNSNIWLKENYENLERDYGTMHEKMCAHIGKLKEENEILRTANDILRSDNNILFKRLMAIETPNNTKKNTIVYRREGEE